VSGLLARDGRARMRYVDFTALRMTAKDPELHRVLGTAEACVVLLGGRAVVRTEAAEWELGARADPFDGAPAAAYLPARSAFGIRPLTDCEIVIGQAPATTGPALRALAPESARLEIRGSGAMERRIHHILMEDQPASSLLVTEVVTPAGHWSSYPPHKHDTDDPPRECLLEEIYYFRFRDPRAFGLMRVYTKDGSLDESIAVRDRDLVLVPRGYHTFSAAPGYDAYYLNVMAGPRREWRITFDPDHERMRW
jgi:5-deoxy-glucuronate isomerase